MGVLGGSAFFYERGTPVGALILPTLNIFGGGGTSTPKGEAEFVKWGLDESETFVKAKYVWGGERRLLKLTR